MKLDYGKSGIILKLDPNWNKEIIQAVKQSPIKYPIKAIRNAITNPIGTKSLEVIVKNRTEIESVCIVVSDGTRPVPSHLILKSLLKELKTYGIQYENIKILIATGLHRPPLKSELKRILGLNLSSNIKVFNHNASDKKFLLAIRMNDHTDPFYINKLYFGSDLKILTGYVEPHFFFGFSGGYKSIFPGLAGTETILENHSANNIASPYARYGSFENNPLSRHSSMCAKKVGVDFAINVCINKFHEITQVAAGDLELVHNRLIDYQKKHVFKEINELFDIVVCGNGGYPLDLNLYQAVKSMAIGEMCVKRGGTIISVNECEEGVGVGQDKFKELIFSGKPPAEIYSKIINKEIILPDQWEIQVLTRILMKAEIYVISQLKEHEIGNIGLKYADSVEEAIKKSLEKHGKDARILILPNGPLMLPFLTQR